MNRLQLAETTLDGPNWVMANRALYLKWKNPGGDYIDRDGVEQGPNPWASFTVRYADPLPAVEMDVTDMVRYWQAHGMDSLIVMRSSGAALNIASDETGTPPGIMVDDSISLPCVAACWVDSSSNVAQDTPDIKNHGMMRFDLSALPAQFTRAVLKLQPTLVYGTSSDIAIFILNMPEFTTDPAADIGVFHEAVATEADVLTYDDLVSEDAIKAGYAVTVPTAVGGVEFVLDERGFTWARCYGNETATRAVAWHKWAQPKNAIPASAGTDWRRDYVAGESHGHDTINMQFMIRIGEDLRDAFNELGMKLPGLAGTYDWSTSGAPTLPAPSSDGTWEARLWHTGRSDAYPHLYRAGTYWYGPDHSLAQFSGNGLVKFFNKVNFLFDARRPQGYRLEQEMRLNTIAADGTPNADGIYRVYVDKALVHEEVGIVIRKYPHVQIQDLPFVNIYHGGMTKPKGRYHIDLGRFITATKYIGSLKDAVVQLPPVVDPDDGTGEEEPIVNDLEFTIDGVLYELFLSPDDMTAIVIGDQRYGVRPKVVTPPPVEDTDCVHTDPYVVPGSEGPWSECRPDGTRERTVTMKIDIVTPASGNGQPCPDVLEWQTVQTEACEYVPPVTTDVIPATHYVAPGKWRNFTIDTPMNDVPDLKAAGSAALILFNGWCGGTRIPRPDGSYGTLCHVGGRQHFVTYDLGGVVTLDTYERRFRWMSRPSLLLQQGMLSVSGWAGDQTDERGRYVTYTERKPDGTVLHHPIDPSHSCYKYPGWVHTYNSVVALPPCAAYPQGAVMIASHSCGGNYEASVAAGAHREGYACTMLHDVTKPFDGHRMLNAEDAYYVYGKDAAGNDIKSVCNDAPNVSEWDSRRGGVWSNPRYGAGQGEGICFSRFNAARDAIEAIESYMPWTILSNGTRRNGIQTWWGTWNPLVDEDLLVFIGDSVAGTPGVFVMVPPDSASPDAGKFIAAKQTGPLPAARVGYMGMRWCSHPRVRAFVGLDNAKIPNVDGVIDHKRVQVAVLRMPPVGQRMDPNAEWVWSLEVVESEDGSLVNVTGEAGTQNGTFGRFAYVPMVNVGTDHEDGRFVFVDALNEPAKVFGLNGM